MEQFYGRALLKLFVQSHHGGVDPAELAASGATTRSAHPTLMIMAKGTLNLTENSRADDREQGRRQPRRRCHYPVSPPDRPDCLLPAGFACPPESNCPCRAGALHPAHGIDSSFNP